MIDDRHRAKDAVCNLLHYVREKAFEEIDKPGFSIENGTPHSLLIDIIIAIAKEDIDFLKDYVE